MARSDLERNVRSVMRGTVSADLSEHLSLKGKNGNRAIAETVLFDVSAVSDACVCVYLRACLLLLSMFCFSFAIHRSAFFFFHVSVKCSIFFSDVSVCFVHPPISLPCSHKIMTQFGWLFWQRH